MKRVLSIITIFLLGITLNVNAAPKTYERGTLENNGVNKKWTITDNNLPNVLRTPAVDAAEHVYDFSEVLTDEEEQQLRTRINEFIQKNKMEIVIVTKELPYNDNIKSYCYNESTADLKEDEFNEEFAADFYDYNDFGIDYELYDGILLFRNTALDPCWNAMYYDMYPFGNAQLYFNEYRYDSILDGIYDELHEEHYFDGFMDFINRVDSYLASGKPSDMEYYYVDEYGYLQKEKIPYSIPWIPCAGVSGLITLITMIILISKNKMVKKATQASEYLNKNSSKVTNRQDIFLHSHTSSYTESSSSGGGGGGGGHSSHSGSSGGGHSSGGGRHG